MKKQKNVFEGVFRAGLKISDIATPPKRRR